MQCGGTGMRFFYSRWNARGRYLLAAVIKTGTALHKMMRKRSIYLNKLSIPAMPAPLMLPLSIITME